MNSAGFLAGTLGLTSITFGTRMKPSDRRDIADEIEVQVLVKRGVDAVGRIDQQQRVAVGRRVDDGFGADDCFRRPVWFSTMNCWPSRSENHCAKMRARMSVDPPAT